MTLDIAENAIKALRMVREARDISYDTETTGVDWRFHKPIGYVVGVPKSDHSMSQEDVVYIPIRHGGGGNLMGGRPMSSPTEGFVVHEFEQALARAFEHRRTSQPHGRVVGHNTKFDVHMSANAGVMLGRRLACTQNMAAMADEHAKKYGLDVVAEREGVVAKKGDAMYKHLAGLFGGSVAREQMANFWRTAGTDPVVQDYATGDGVSTWQVYLKLLDKLHNEGMQTICDLENDLIWTIFRMERTGIRVDMGRVDQLRSATEDKISKLLAEFPVGFNTRSPVHMREAMQEAGHTDWPLTEKGSPSFTEKWLKKNPLGKKIIEIRQNSNLISSFVNPLAERHVFNGRVHATLNQLKNDDKGTISGRFSCSDPNLQQVPKRVKEIAKPFRRLFVADEGWTFWERDYSQCEPRLFAHYSQDEALVRGYNSTPFRDAHTVVAEMLEVERDPTAKRMNMGIFTGMQPKSFAAHMDWDLTRATKAWNAWMAAFPGVPGFQNKAKARLKARGYVHTILGRRCRLDDPRFAYRGTSKIIQGSNADIIKLKLLEADRLCEDNGDIVRVLMTVHDSFNGQYQNTPEARALFEHMVAEMAEVQTPPFNLTVPFVLEGEEGRDWCEATWGAE
jgi:DNA polymerase I-like protein with 3'-5' exonuclease and polymerase domains